MVPGLWGFWNLDLIFLTIMVGIAFSHCNCSSSSPSNSWASKSTFSIRARAPIHNTNTNLVVSFVININNDNYYAARRRRRRLRCSPSAAAASSSSSGKVEEEDGGSGRELVFTSLMGQRGGKMVAQLVGTFNQLTHRNTAITTLASSSLLLLFNTLKLAIPILQSLPPPPPPLALHARSPLTKALSVAFILADLQVLLARALLFFSLFYCIHVYIFINQSIFLFSIYIFLPSICQLKTTNHSSIKPLRAFAICWNLPIVISSIKPLFVDNLFVLVETKSPRCLYSFSFHIILPVRLSE